MRRSPGWLLLTGLLALTAVAYLPSLGGEFQFDDTPVIERIERREVTLGRLLRGSGDDRPLTALTLLADWGLAGLDVRVFHATNVLFHLVAVALVFSLTRLTLGRLGWPAPERAALAVAGLFALHPLQTQAVSYVVQRAEILAAITYMATLLLLLGSESPASRTRRVAAWTGAGVTFALGLAAKQVIVTVPAAYVLHRVFFPHPRAGAPWRAVLARAGPLAAVSVYMAWSSVLGATEPHAGLNVPRLPPTRYALTQLGVIPAYLRMLAWPAGQNIDHDFPLSAGFADPRTLAGAAALAALAGGAAWLFLASRSRETTAWGRAARLASFGIAWFLLVLAPTSSVVPLADVLVEHRVYLASWGILLGATGIAWAWLAAAVPERQRRIAATALVVLAWGALLAVTWQRNEIWGSRLALWSHAAQKSPNKARARSNHGHALRAAGRPGDAVGEYAAALRLAGEQPALLRGLGGALYETGRVDEAVLALERGLALAPDDSLALGDLAVCLAHQGRLADAERAARRALVSDPRNALAHLTLGNIRLERGEARTALEAYAAAEALAPHQGTPALNAALAHAQLGDRAAACADLARYRRVQKAHSPQAHQLARDLECPPARR